MRLLIYLLGCLALSSRAQSREQFDEKLILRTHSRGHLSAYFNFKTFIPVNIDLPWGSYSLIVYTLCHLTSTRDCSIERQLFNLSLIQQNIHVVCGKNIIFLVCFSLLSIIMCFRLCLQFRGTVKQTPISFHCHC